MDELQSYVALEEFEAKDGLGFSSLRSFCWYLWMTSRIGKATGASRRGASACRAAPSEDFAEDFTAAGVPARPSRGRGTSSESRTGGECATARERTAAR